MSTAMLKAAQAFPRHGAAIKDIKAWLYRVLRNAWMDTLVGERRHVRVESHSAEAWDELAPLGEQPSAEELMMRHERSWRLRQQLSALPDSLKAPLVMRFHQERSYEDIATRLGLTPCNVRKRVQFGTQRLRHTLVDESS